MYFEYFQKQAFLHDLYKSDTDRVSLVNDVERVRDGFYWSFKLICDKHAPIQKFRRLREDNGLKNQATLAWKTKPGY